jgi:hypothetical protein
MTDVQVERMSPVYTIALKGEAGDIEVNTDEFDDATCRALMQAGIEHFINKANGAAKAITGVTKATGADLAARQKQIREAAEKTIQNLKDGLTPGKKKAKVTGAVQIEAMRLAKDMLRNLIKGQNQTLKAYSAKEQTAGAKIILEQNPHLLVVAEANLAKRADDTKGLKGISLESLFGDKANSEEVKAKPRKTPVRKAKGDVASVPAGMVANKQKPATGATKH